MKNRLPPAARILLACGSLSILIFLIAVGLVWFVVSRLTASPQLEWTTQTLTATSPVCGKWEVTTGSYSSGSLDTFGAKLEGISALSDSDVWVVGTKSEFHKFGRSTDTSTLALHWDGTSWTDVPIPNPENLTLRELTDVAAISANDAWAVGNYAYYDGQRVLTAHWDGRGWKLIPNPYTGQSVNQINALAAASADNIWAAGNNADGPMLMRWDGAAWSTVPVSGSIGLNGTATFGNGNVWIVGSSARQGLAMRWNGSQLNTVTVPQYPQWGAALNGVTALSANDAWAVGFKSEGSPKRTLILHWDGDKWSEVPAPKPNDNWYEDPLAAISAVAPDNAWAVGQSGGYSEQKGTLIEHWDGSHWGIIDSPKLENAELSDVITLPSGSVWAVGRYYQGNRDAAIVVHYIKASCPNKSKLP